MDTSRGIFIALEGTDGSGKGAQLSLLAKRLAKAGHDVAIFDFPQYQQPSSYFVKQYLNSAYNSTGGGVPGPYTSSLFYALDRYEAAPKIRQALHKGKVVLANRYVGSNMAHQGTKFANPEERRGYFIWVDNLEFEMLRIPRPTVSYILRVPASIAQTLNAQKPPHTYTDRQKDLHESDPTHSAKSVDVYDDIAQLFPKDFTRIDCVRDNTLLPIDIINDILWQKIQPLLPEPKHTGEGHIEQASSLVAPATASNITTEPLVRKDEHGHAITTAGKRFLETHVTSSVGNVYALSGKLGPEINAALVARFAQKAGDLRSTLLLEFATAAETDAKIQSETRTTYPDPLKNRLANAYIVLSAISGVLANTVAQTASGVLIEQSQAVNAYAIKDTGGNYGYHIPETLSPDLKLTYRRSMDKMFDTYNKLVSKLAAHLTEQSHPDAQNTAVSLASAVLPLAAHTTAVLYATSEALEQCITNLMGGDLPEARTTGLRMLAEVRKVFPHLHAGTDKSDQGGAQMVYNASVRTSMQQLASEQLPENHAPQASPLRLVRLWPRNELDLLPDMLYPYSNRPLHDITAEITNWSYSTKVNAFEAYLGERKQIGIQPGKALNAATYTWDLVTDCTVLRELCQLMGRVESQQITPRYGYDVPQVIEDAGVSDQFEACFDASLELHSLLQQAGFTTEAAYATLRGHKLRWQLTHTARDILSLDIQSTPLHESTKALLVSMREKLAEAHPIVGEAVKI